MTLRQGLAHGKGPISISGMLDECTGGMDGCMEDTPKILSKVKCVQSHKKYQGLGVSGGVKCFGL